MHKVIADALNKAPGISATTATLQETDHGLTVDRLAKADVLLWWGHAAHGEVDDRIVDRVAEAVWAGMGLIVLHSGHFAKIFKRLMGTPCNLSWREAGERERLWCVNPSHPIAQGLPAHFVLEHEEMYGEPFGIKAASAVPGRAKLQSWPARIPKRKTPPGRGNSTKQSGQT